MLALAQPRRQRSTRCPFLTPPWHDRHPDFLRLDAELPADHHARWLRRAVARLDLSSLRLAYANRGSRAYPPELLLPFVLLMYAKKLLCPAEWFRQARTNDEAKWLLRGLRPGRSALYSFRDRTEPFLDDWHRQLIDWAKAEKITTGQRGSLDGSFVAALASRHRLLRCRTVDGRLALLALAVWLDEDSAEQASMLLVLLCGLATLFGDVTALPLVAVLLTLLLVLLQPTTTAVLWTQRLPSWLPRSSAGRQRMLRRYQHAQQRLQQRLAPYQGKKRLSKKDVQAVQRAKINPSDPEAALGWDKLGTFRPLYNLQMVQATDAPLVLSWELFSRNNDEGMLRPMLEKTAQQCGRPLAEVIVDGAYLNIGDLLFCESQAIKVYAPPQASDKPASVPSDKAAAPKKYGKERFGYDATQRVYHCPAGKPLPQVSRTSEERQGGMRLTVLVHRAAASDCQGCSQREHCTSGKHGRVVKRYEGEEVLERLKERMAARASQEIYRQRKQTIEQGFAEVKEHRGLRVFRCFGRERCRAQAGLTILASNALTIVRTLRRRERDGSIPSPKVREPA